MQAGGGAGGVAQVHPAGQPQGFQPRQAKRPKSAFPLLLPLSIFPSIRAFSTESVLCIRLAKCWNFSFSIALPMNIQD